MAYPDGVEVHGPARERYGAVLSDEALGLVAELQRELGPTREALLARRGERQASFNSGARVFMADFEDANAPTWENMFGGQQNLVDAIEGTISFESPDGRQYRLNEETATLMPRPRGWHLPEKHITVDGRPVSASLAD